MKMHEFRFAYAKNLGVTVRKPCCMIRLILFEFKPMEGRTFPSSNCMTKFRSLDSRYRIFKMKIIVADHEAWRDSLKILKKLKYQIICRFKNWMMMILHILKI